MERKRIKQIDGLLFERMIRGGLDNLIACENEINALNVFPVADGDTGTNMRLTIENGIRSAKSNKDLKSYLKTLSSGMLLGARGNSGVILSQIFKGIYLELSRCDEADTGEMRNAFIRGYKAAYESVIKPVEGTILTVAREGIENTVRLLKRIPDMETLFEAYLSVMEKSLADTPKLLPVLAESGVVDSGAKGYITIVRGMLDAMQGKSPRAQLPESVNTAAAQTGSEAAQTIDMSSFDENSTFEEGYCMEFILQLMNGEKYSNGFRVERFIEMLKRCGDSLVVVRNEMRVKVHVHTRKPAPIMEYVMQFGEFLTFKLENMQLQHNDYEKKRQERAALQTAASAPGAAAPVQSAAVPAVPQNDPRRPLAVIAVVNGEGNRQLFSDLGCARVIDGGATMNASANDFVEAIRSLNADHIVILPDNPNMMLAAEQGVRLANVRNVRVMSAVTLAEGYSALAMDIPDSEDVPARIKQMEQGIRSVDTVHVTRAVRDYEQNGIHCRVNDYITTSGGHLLSASENLEQAMIDGLMSLEGIEDKESCIFLRGECADETLEAEIEEMIGEKLPMMECSFLSGGQAIYDWIIGVM